MSGMFKYCEKLKELHISNFDTKDIWEIDKMFYGCSRLEILDIVNFSTDKIKNRVDMFDGCNIKTLNTKDKKILRAYETRKQF